MVWTQQSSCDGTVNTSWKNLTRLVRSFLRQNNFASHSGASQIAIFCSFSASMEWSIDLVNEWQLAIWLPPTFGEIDKNGRQKLKTSLPDYGSIMIALC